MEDRFRYVPEEIVLNILPALPAKSLIRFRCVSKQWSRWISKTKLGQGKKLIVRSSAGSNSFKSIDEKLQVKDIDLSRIRLNPCVSFLLASCGGLLLIKIDTDLFLWNPTIHSCWKALSLEGYHGSGSGAVTGLCYDSHNDDYKVVMVSGKPSREYVQVGSCRNNSWEAIEFPYDPNSIVSGPVLNNYIHWYTAYTHKIIYFDPKMNLFLEVQMPESMRKGGDWIRGLGVLDGCLSMARGSPYQALTEVLVMKEHGVKESWQTLFKTIEKWPLIPYFCLEKKDEVLVGSRPNVVTLNLRTGKEVQMMEGYGCVYEETMVEPSKYLTGKGALSNVNVQKVIVQGSNSFSFRLINHLAEAEDVEIKGDQSRDPGFSPCIYGSCNGFLLIRIGIDLYLWNPLFRCTDVMLLNERLKQYPPENVISGLCFDSDKNDYKVVLVLDHYDWRDRSVVVGSFRTKSWSEIYIQHISTNLKSGPTLNNHLHMWSSDAVLSHQIVYFDLKMNRFTRIPLPDLPSCYGKSCIHGLGVLDGHLCMVHSDSFDGNNVYEMKQYGVKESWTCLFQFNYKNLSCGTPLFFCDEERRKVLIHAFGSDGYSAILSFNIGNNLCTEVMALDGEGYNNGGPFVYVETFGRPASLMKAGNTKICQKKADLTDRRKQLWDMEASKSSREMEVCPRELPKNETKRVKKFIKAAVLLSLGMRYRL